MRKPKKSKFKELNDRDWLLEQYMAKKKSVLQIAREIGCNDRSVRKALAGFNVPIRGCSEAAVINSENRDYRGENNPKWRGGEVLVGGYLYILSKDHPSATKNGYVCEHRLVMEEHLGRFLKKGEVVHHRNHNPVDNRLENLELVESNGVHFIRHHLKERDSGGRFLLTK